MTHTSLQIDTSDGRCETHVFQPDGAGPWPGVIIYMDAVGVRPALFEIAERIASERYYVLLPDVFYRVPFESGQTSRFFNDPVFRQDVMTRVMPAASHANVMRDTDALLAHFGAQHNVNSERIGIVGYCMGGRLALYAAGHFGERITAAASYHGGRMATDGPDSPHWLASGIRARMYIAGAIEDPTFDDAQKARLEQALTDAGVDHTIETYNARHGWVPRDTPVHDQAATAKHWETLLSLFNDTLR